MWKWMRGVLVSLLLVAGVAPFGSHRAEATFTELCDKLKSASDHSKRLVCLFTPVLQNLGRELAVADDGQAGVARPIASVQKLISLTATMQAGEPNEGGLMTRSVWVGFKAPAAERIVIHTYGSSDFHLGGGSTFDSVLVAYRGTEIDNLVRITGNDNRPIPGLTGPTAKNSLIQFNTTTGTDYRIQIGSRAQAEGDISLNVFRLPPTGGLSAFMYKFAGFPFNSRDYVCDLFTSSTTILCDAQFIVHNSTSQTLTVTPSTTLGAGVTAPTPFALLPGASKVATFAVTPAIDRTVRTVSGHFVFTGRVAATVVTEARHRALILVRSTSAVQDLVRAEVTPTMQTGYINEPMTFVAKLVNTGTVTAIGCHFRSKSYSDLKTTFYRIHPTTGARLGADNAPIDIAAGQSLTFKVNVASQSARDADYVDPEAIPDCANHSRNRQLLRGGFDITASSRAEPLPSVELQSSTPAPGGILNVPATGFAYYRLRTINRGTTRSVTAEPYYQSPFDDPANREFTVSICRTNPTTGVCLGAYGFNVDYTATKNVAATFSVRVKAPAVAPAFDPDRRRVYVDFTLADSPYIRVGAHGIAVRKQ